MDRFWDLCLGRLFDFIYGVETCREVPLEALRYYERDIVHSRRYQAHPLKPVKKALTDLSINYKDYDFIDIGSGKGRALFLASQFPFREVKGIDICPELCQKALENREKFQRKVGKTHSNISILNQNVLQAQWGSSKKLFFLYNPFDGIILKKFIQTYKESGSPHQEDIFLYLNPIRGYLFEMAGIPEVISYPHPNTNKIIKIYSQKLLLN
jgi:SAM-dependent methyltransferase